MCLIIVICPYTTFVHGPNGNVCRTGKVKKNLITRSVRSLLLMVTLEQLGNGENKRGVRQRQMKLKKKCIYVAMFTGAGGHDKNAGEQTNKKKKL